MKFLLLVLCIFSKIVAITAQYGLYGGLSLPGFGNRPKYDNYADGYGGYPPYGASSYSGSYPSGYVNSNYGGNANENLGNALGDISAAFLRSLSEFLLGSEPEPFPFGPMGPFQPSGRNRYQNQYGYGVNAGVYAGTYGGQSITGPRGPYGGINTNIGGSYGGLSGWPLFPWLPTLAPPATTTTPSPVTTTSTTTSTVPLPPPNEEENPPPSEGENPPPEASVVEVPITDE